jgi:hypothetical protein
MVSTVSGWVYEPETIRATTELRPRTVLSQYRRRGVGNPPYPTRLPEYSI